MTECIREGPLTGLRESESAWSLGPLSVHKERATYTLDDPGIPRVLSDTAWLRIEASGEERRALFVLDDPAEAPRASDPDAPRKERLIGWVPAAQLDELEAWCAWLNGHIAELLYARQPRPEQVFPRALRPLDPLELPPRGQ